MVPGDVLESPLLRSLDDGDRRALASFLDRMSTAPGAVVIEQGARDRDMYFLMSGTVSLRRGDVEMGTMGPGQHFGELGLVADRLRAISVVATTPVELARLTLEAFGRLSAADPALSLRFVSKLVSGLGVRLADMTESVGYLLRERSLPRRIMVRARILDGKNAEQDPRPVKIGTQLRELLPASIDGLPVVAALVDRRAASLVTPISSDCSIEALTTAHWEGMRIYRRSLGLLLLEAAHSLDPRLTVRLEHSLGVGQRIYVQGVPDAQLRSLAQDIERRMLALAGENRQLREEWWTVAEARQHFRDSGWLGAAELLRSWRDQAVALSSFGEAYALSPGPIAASTGILSEFAVITESDDESSANRENAFSSLVLVYGISGTAPESLNGRSIAHVARDASRHTSALANEHHRWLSTLSISSVGEFNRACLDGEVSQVIRVAEGFQEKRSSQIADAIRDHENDVRVVCIAGPSSSGKTTFIKRLRVQLQVNGIHPVSLSLDNYYCDRSDTPRDAQGEYDYESLGALRRDLLSEHLTQLLDGDEVKTSRYDFGSGTNVADGGPRIRLRDRQVLLLEGIHGLNPQLLASIAEEQLFRIFICPLAQLPFDRLARVHGSDLRLLRRIVRDRHSRGATAANTIARWPSVRRGERRHIFPHQGNADAVFDSSLIYEVSVLKVFAERYLLEVSQDSPEYTTAFRLLGLCDRFVTIYPDHVPPTSILREFIGGSGFEF